MGGEGALASESQCVYCQYQKFFVILYNILNPSKVYVYLCTLLTKDKTEDHQSHFNAHRLPRSQDERLLMKPVLTRQHVLS